MKDVTIEFTFASGVIGHKRPRPKIIVRHPICFTGLVDVSAGHHRGLLHSELDEFLDEVDHFLKHRSEEKA